MIYKETGFNENTLVLGLKNKNVTALRVAFELYAPAINGIMSRMMNRDNSDEYLCGLFMKFWNCIDEYDSSKCKLFTWLTIVMRNYVVNDIGYQVDILNFNRLKDVELFDVLYMVLFNGYKIEEIATLLNLSKEEVRQQIRRDILSFRQCIEVI